MWFGHLVDPLGDPVGLFRKQRHSNNPQSLRPTRQAKFLKSGRVSTASPLAAAPPPHAATNACGMEQFNAFKLAGCRGDAYQRQLQRSQPLKLFCRSMKMAPRLATNRPKLCSFNFCAIKRGGASYSHEHKPTNANQADDVF